MSLPWTINRSLSPFPLHGVRELTGNEHYWIREHRLPSGPLELSNRPGPRVLMVTSGRIKLGELKVSTGETAMVPAAAFEVVRQ